MEVVSKKRLCTTPYVNIDMAQVVTKSKKVLEHVMLDYLYDSVVALVVNSGKVMMVKQKRFISGKEGWECPGGWLLAGENPLNAVRRKVEDETGFEVKSIKRLGASVPLVGICNKNIYYFLVEVGSKVKGFNFDLVESVKYFSFNNLMSLVVDGSVFDEATLACLMFAKAQGCY
jgi:ADP-ribose pyrophosphatase